MLSHTHAQLVSCEQRYASPQERYERSEIRLRPPHGRAPQLPAAAFLHQLTQALINEGGLDEERADSFQSRCLDMILEAWVNLLQEVYFEKGSSSLPGTILEAAAAVFALIVDRKASESPSKIGSLPANLVRLDRHRQRQIEISQVVREGPVAKLWRGWQRLAHKNPVCLLWVQMALALQEAYDEEDDQDDEGELLAAHEERIAAIATVGRASAHVSLPLLSERIRGSAESLKAAVMHGSDPSVALEQLCALLQVAAAVLADPGDGEIPCIPLVLIQASDAAEASGRADPVVELSQAVLGVCDLAVTDNSHSVLSPRMVEVLAGAVARWADSYLLVDTSCASRSLAAVFSSEVTPPSAPGTLASAWNSVASILHRMESAWNAVALILDQMQSVWNDIASILTPHTSALPYLG